MVPVALWCPTLATSSAERLQTSIFVGPSLQLSRFRVATGTILGPIWDQKGIPQKGGTVSVALWCSTLATSSAEGLQTSIFVRPPLQLSWFWVAKGTFLDQFGTQMAPCWGHFWTL